jgi:prepilin-type processing-associated H-X9-DG protein
MGKQNAEDDPQTPARANWLTNPKTYYRIGLWGAGLTLAYAFAQRIAANFSVFLPPFGIPANLALILLPVYVVAMTIRRIWSVHIALWATAMWGLIWFLLGVVVPCFFIVESKPTLTKFLANAPGEFVELAPWGLLTLLMVLGVWGFTNLLPPRRYQTDQPADTTDDNKSRRQHYQFTLAEVIVIFATTGLLLGILMPALARRRVIPNRVQCGRKLRDLRRALDLYCAETGRYPTPVTWCDLIKTRGYIEEQQLKCALDKVGPCSYAINPNCDPNSPDDVVLIFESAPGWNQHGGPELLNTKNHGDGCNILFKDGSAAFIKTEDLGTLNWGTDLSKN